MGLDSYIYKIYKLNDEEKKDIDAAKTLDEVVSFTGLTVFPLETEDDRKKVEEIMDYLYVIKREQTFIDRKKFLEYFHIPEGSKRKHSSCQYSPGSCIQTELWHFHGDPEDELREISFDWNNDKHLMTIRLNEFGLCRKEDELFYWRSNRRLQNRMNELRLEEKGEPIMNCGYYPLTEKMIKAVMECEGYEHCYEELLVSKPGEYVICYHEWH